MPKNIDITKLTHRQVLDHFEKERHEWLSIGMNEADIYRIHFGEENENGRGGDYRIWLDERRHTRSDHKYALGTPISFECLACDEYADSRDEIECVEFYANLENALRMLTDLQRKYFVLVFVKGYSYSEIATVEGKNRSTIFRLVESAVKKIKPSFSGYATNAIIQG
jgi:RNA polymerase sigma factor (sigma-70 family)